MAASFSRQTNSRLVRDGLSFRKKMEAFRYHTALDDLSYNFSKYHGSLRVKLDNPQQTREEEGTPKKWSQRTPAMAAGITDHKWSMGELMTCPIIEPCS